jgi:hypothetical protein
MDNQDPGEQPSPERKIDVPAYRADPQQSAGAGGFVVFLKIIGVMLIGVFVLGGLIFASCVFR